MNIPIVHLNSLKGDRLIKNIRNTRVKRHASVEKAVAKILDDIKILGDKAVFSYTKKFEKRSLTAKTMRLAPSLIKRQAKACPAPLAKAIREAAKRIKAYHSKQGIISFDMNTSEGRLQQKVLPLRRVGLYVPGGQTAYSSTVLMNAIPALIAGVKELVVVTPVHGKIEPAVAYALSLLNISEVYCIGGAQAIGALAYGTKTIAPVDKIVGPGNSYVSTAKKAVYGMVDIDSVAGPSEVVIWADTSANPTWVALDLLAQAEHGSGDEAALCITESESFAKKVAEAIAEEISVSSKKAIFEKLAPHAIAIFVTKNKKESAHCIDAIAPEHLEIMTSNARKDCALIHNAAAIFLGHFTPVALGDYYIGTNHVLPTGSAARYASPLGVDSFQKRISIAEVSQKGLARCVTDISVFARAENFVHHALCAERRIA
jgi:histidinol dehydrogenase